MVRLLKSFAPLGSRNDNPVKPRAFLSLMKKKLDPHGEIFGMFRQLGKTPAVPAKIIDKPTDEQIKINKGLLPKKHYPLDDLP